MSAMTSRERALRIARENAVKEVKSRAEQAWHNELPKRFRTFSYDKDVASKNAPIGADARRKITKFVKSPESFLVMHGPSGTGKTTAACAVVSKIIENYAKSRKPLPGGTPKFFTANDFLRKLSVMDSTSKFSRQSVSENVRAQATNAAFLVIDDIGAANEGTTEFQERLFWDILNSRYNDPDKITVLTTNMPLLSASAEAQSFESWVGPSMWDRIQSESIRVMFNGQSMRGADL